MSWICPACGHENKSNNAMCMCGYQAEDYLLSDDEEEKEEESGLRQKSIIEEFDATEKKASVKAEKRNVKIKVQEKAPTQKQFPPAGEVTIKEIDAWTFSYSKNDECIYAGTPALYPFRLQLGLEDLEELLEFLYEETGKKKEAPQISGKDVRDVVEMVDEIIEEKKASLKITFSQAELQKIAEIINEKLQAE